ncbi:MAG: hypothetical protein L3J67_02770 [Hyphomicrobiaceae bacterium]|nr:hypothetical protein [Hyphomicrobiaceae bacterium]
MLKLICDNRIEYQPPSILTYCATSKAAMPLALAGQLFSLRGLADFAASTKGKPLETIITINYSKQTGFQRTGPLAGSQGQSPSLMEAMNGSISRAVGIIPTALDIDPFHGIIAAHMVGRLCAVFSRF